jgi:nucleotide-binding universal stress UspA family protein
MYRTILIPLDGSPLAEQSLHHLGHVAAPGAQVLLIQVAALLLQIAIQITDAPAFGYISGLDGPQ